MRRIFAGYFEALDEQAWCALQVIAWMPVALALAIRKRLSDRIEDAQEWIGRRLIVAGLHWMPRHSIVREQTVFLLRDRRRYERYVGYCEIRRVAPLSFDSWRAELAWVGVKMRTVA